MNCTIKSIIVDVAKSLDVDVSGSFFNDSDIYSKIITRLDEENINKDPNFIQAIASEVKKYCLKNLVDQGHISKTVKNYFTYNSNGESQFDLTSYREFKQFATREIGNAVIMQVFNPETEEYVVIDSKDKLQDSIDLMISRWGDNFGDEFVEYGMRINDQFKANLNSIVKTDYFRYILLQHSKELIPELSNGYLKYNYESGRFEINDTSHHVAGWQRKDDRSAYEDTSGALKLMIESTPLYDIRETRSGRRVARITNKNLTSAMFYEASNEFLRNIIKNDWRKYRQIVENPRLLIEEIIKYTDDLSVLNSNLDKILYSIRARYFFIPKEGDITQRNSINLKDAYIKSNSGIIKSDNINYLDALLVGMSKYVKQVYQRYDGDNNSTSSTDVLDKGVIALQMANNVEYIISKTGLPKKNGVKLNANEIDNLSQDELLFYFNNLTNFDFLQFKSQDLPYSEIKAVLEKIVSNKKLTSSDANLIALAKYYLDKNPEIIKSVTTRSDGSKVPNYRLANLANTFHHHLANTQNRLEKSKTGYESPLQHSFLFRNPNLIKESRLRLDLYSKEKGKYKLASELTPSEQLYLAMYFDYFKSMEDKGEMIFEAITPSDKSAIPFPVVNALLKIDGLNKSIKDASWKEMRDFFKSEGLKIQTQFLENSINLFNKILGLTSTGDYISDINNIDEALKNKTVDDLNNAVDKYNRINGTDYVLNNVHDYIVKSKRIRFNRLLYGYYLKFKEDGDKFFEYEYQLFKKDANNVLNSGNFELFAKDKFGFTEEALKKYFFTNAMMSYHWTLLTTGSTIAHKYKTDEMYATEVTKDGKKTKIDLPLNSLTVDKVNKSVEQAFITSTKRMVADTATGHAYQRGILTGLPNETNHATLSDYESPLADLNRSKEQKMNVWDGAVFAPIVSLWLSDNSTVDYKVEGFVRKTLGHSMLASKGVATLNKSATFGISNAFILKNLNGRFKFKEMLRRAYQPATFKYNGNWVDITKNFNGKRNNISGYYQINTENGLQVFKVTNLKWLGENKYQYKRSNLTTGESVLINTELNNLWDVYNMLGGEFSGEIVQDSFGGDKFVYSESSQRVLFDLVNSVGAKINEDVLSQEDVDQFLKKRMIHYFPTESTNKSAQLPLTSNKVFRETGDDSKYPLHIVKLDISNTAVQLDADHIVDDAEVSEPTQLISFMAQKGLVQNITKEMYESLADLIKHSSSKLTEDIDNRKALVNLFGKGLVKTFLKDNVDVLGLAQALMSEVNEKMQANPGVALDDLDIKIPFSDENLMGKVASDVIIYTNGFIKRKYPGSADIMVPSYDIVMLYEDENGNKYNSMDIYQDPSIMQHLQEIDDLTIVNPLEIEFGDMYYLHNDKGEYVDFDGKILPYKTAVELNTYEEYLRAQEGGYVITKSYISPRNLKGRSVFVNVRLADGTERKVNIFSLAMRYSLHNLDMNKEDEKRKANDIRLFMNNVLYKAISNKNVDVLNESGGFIEYDPITGFVQLPIVEILGTEYKNPEMSASYKYSSILNIEPGVSINDIKKMGPAYFRNQMLLDRKVIYPDEMTPADFVLKANNGNHLAIYFDKESISDFATEENKIEVPTDDTGIYRVNEDGEELYPIDGIEFYQADDINFIVITGDPTETLGNILASGIYSGYDGEINSEISKLMKRYRIFKVNPEYLDDLANKQYQSFWETLNYIVARIPAQSEQFAMPCEIVDLFQSPYNVSLVNKFQTYEQGSDYELINSL